MYQSFRDLLHDDRCSPGGHDERATLGVWALLLGLAHADEDVHRSELTALEASMRACVDGDDRRFAHVRALAEAATYEPEDAAPAARAVRSLLPRHRLETVLDALRAVLWADTRMDVREAAYLWRAAEILDVPRGRVLEVLAPPVAA